MGPCGGLTMTTAACIDNIQSAQSLHPVFWFTCQNSSSTGTMLSGAMTISRLVDHCTAATLAGWRFLWAQHKIEGHKTIINIIITAYSTWPPLICRRGRWDYSNPSLSFAIFTEMPYLSIMPDRLRKAWKQKPRRTNEMFCHDLMMLTSTPSPDQRNVLSHTINCSDAYLPHPFAEAESPCPLVSLPLNIMLPSHEFLLLSLRYLWFRWR